MKPNAKKCKSAGSEALKKVKGAVCGMKSVDLGSETIKILEMFSPTMRTQKYFFNIITDTQSVNKVWRMRNFRFEWRIVVFKSLMLSKRISSFIFSKVLNEVVHELQFIQKSIAWKTSKM